MCIIDSLECIIGQNKLYNRQIKVYYPQYEVYNRQFKVSKLKNKKKNIFVALICFRRKSVFPIFFVIHRTCIDDITCIKVDICDAKYVFRRLISNGA